MLGDGVRDREGVEARDERGGVSDGIARKLRGIINIVKTWGLVRYYIVTYTRFQFLGR